MTLLSPIPALIAAAITVPALLILYFLKLRRRPIRVSSTLLWDQAFRDLQVNIPFRLIRPTWLLLLQLLILAMFLLAFARPAIDLPRGSPARVILLIDRSASMSARDGGSESAPRTRLDAAKARALARLDQLARSGSTFAVIAFAAEPMVLSTFSDASTARATIAAIEPSDQPGNLRAALQLAGGLLTGDADESTARPRGLAVLFSDGSFTDSTSLSLAGAEFRFERAGPAPAAEDAAPPAPDNLGLVAIAARREWEDPGVIRVFARIQNASDREVTAPIFLSLDGRDVQSSIVTIPGAVRPSATVTFTLESRDGGTATVRIDRDDQLPTDNRASLVLAPATKPRLLLVIPDRTATPGPSPEWIITSVIQELQLPMRIMSASTFAQESGPAPADLIIFDRVTPAAAPGTPTLSFGAGIPGISLGASPEAPTYVLSWSRNHPVLRHASLDGVFIARPLPMTGIAPEDELARGSSGPLIARAPGAGPRRLIVAFELSQSNWPIQVAFPVFLASAIDYLTMRGEDRAGAAFTTAEPVVLERTGTAPIILDGPRRLTFQPAPDPAGPISLGILERAGVYRVTGLPEGRPDSLAVNLLDEAESALDSRGSLRVSGQIVHAAAGDSGPREVWPWFILAALVLLCFEWLVNAWMMRV